MMSDSEKVSLRRHFRKLRRELPPDQHADNALALQRNLLRSLLILRYQNFALYNAADGEISTCAINRKLWEHSKATALPVLRHSDFSTPPGRQQLRFATFASTTRLVRGSYDLLEPETLAPSAQHEFIADVIFLPLVAFDQNGTRLGMGGGYYDRYTSHSKHSRILRVGLAHSIQEAKQPLPREPWDVSLDAVVTEQRAHAFNNRAHSLLFGSSRVRD